MGVVIFETDNEKFNVRQLCLQRYEVPSRNSSSLAVSNYKLRDFQISYGGLMCCNNV